MVSKWYAEESEENMYRIVQRILWILLILAIALFGLGYYRTRMMRDTEGPVITVEEETIVVSVTDSEESLLRGIRAYDRKDGDVSASLVVQGMSNFIEKGRRQITVAAFDQDNNVAKATREIRYHDYVSPRFSLTQPLSFAIGTQESSIIKCFRAQDSLDGDLSEDITIELEDPEGWLDMSNVGESRVVCTVINSAGDVAQLPVTIQIYDPSEYNRGTKIRLLQSILYLERGAAFDPWDYVVNMEKYEEWIPLNRRQVRITNPVDTSQPGVYEVLYTVSDEENDYVTSVRLPVIVE